MRPLAVALLSLVALDAVRAEPVAPTSALRTVEAYSRAVTAADCDRIAPLSAVLARHPEARDSLCETVTSWHAAGMVERLRQPTASLSSGARRMVVVPNERVMAVDGRPQVGDGVYVAVSGDAGRHWQVIDIGCDELPKWVRHFYPAYDGRPGFASRVDVLRQPGDRAG